jgi:hypothetical protein
MRNKLNPATAELWAYSLASFAAYKLIALRANLPVFCKYIDGKQVFLIPSISRGKINIIVLYRPLRALLSPERLADTAALQDTLATPDWRKVCRAFCHFEISANGPHFIDAAGSVRARKSLANTDVRRIPTFPEVNSALHLSQ